MLLGIGRLKPCSALASDWFPRLLTARLVPSVFAAVRRGKSKSSLPLGPSTKTFWPLTSTFTFSGMVIGCFPMRDINQQLPNIAEKLSTDVTFSGLNTGHEALGSRKDGRAQSAAHAGNLGRAHVAAQSGRTDPTKPLNHAFAAFILELELDLFHRSAFDGHIGDVSLFLKNVSDALLEFGVRNFYRGQQRAMGVADAGQHVGNRISHNYQLALVTPGMRPFKAASRKVSRDEANLRR